MRTLSIYSCTRDTKERTALFGTLAGLDLPPAQFVENNTMGLAQVYNGILDAAAPGEIVLFMHDDIMVRDRDLASKVEQAMLINDWAVVGLAGATRYVTRPGMERYGWDQGDPKVLSGVVAHRFPDGRFETVTFGPVPRRCVVLDGMFLAVDTAKIARVRFDPAFRFHFYDLDFCLSAHRAGLMLGTIEATVCHLSTGCFDGPMFDAALDVFLRKWRRRGSFDLGKDV